MPNQPVERASVVLHTDSFNFRAVVQAACAQINEQDSVNSIAIRFYLYGLQEGMVPYLWVPCLRLLILELEYMKEIMAITNARMKAIFEMLMNSENGGIPGVLRIDSGKPGPILGVTACTHGNEPSGLAVFDYLLNTLDIYSTLQRGTLYLVLNNIKATEKFFTAKTREEVSQARYTDVNMNRLPKNVLALKNDRRYEIQRVQDLLSIWRQFTVGLDIHSTTVPTDPMFISRGGKFNLIEDLVRGFPIERLISNIDDVMRTAPTFSFYGSDKQDVPVFAIEAGQHTEPASSQRAIECAIALLQNLKMIPGISTSVVGEYKEYCIEEVVTFPDDSFDFVSNFKTYDVIYEGQVIARSIDGEEIVAPFDGHLILPTSKRGKEKDISEEVAFVSRPMQIRKISTEQLRINKA